MFYSGLTLRVWMECRLEEVTCESSQGDFSVGHTWPIIAFLKEAFGERPLQRSWVLGQLFNCICSMPCLNVFVFMWSWEPWAHFAWRQKHFYLNMAFQLCRTEDVLLACSSGSAQAEQGCILGCSLSNVLSVLEPLARDAKGNKGTHQGVSVSRMCCCRDDVKEVELWDHYWPGSSQSLNHWAYIIEFSIPPSPVIKFFTIMQFTLEGDQGLIHWSTWREVHGQPLGQLMGQDPGGNKHKPTAVPHCRLLQARYAGKRCRIT